MTEQHNVSTDQIRFAAAIGMRDTRAHILRPDDAGSATFDAWLAAHDAQVLRDAADAWAAAPDAWGDNEKDYRNELRDRADLIARTS